MEVDSETTISVSEIRFYYLDLESCTLEGVESTPTIMKVDEGIYS